MSYRQSAEPIREQLGEIDRVSCVHPEREEAEDGQDHDQHSVALGNETDDRGDDERGDVEKDEGLLSPDPRRDGTEEHQPDAAPDGLDDAVGDLGFLGRLLGGESVSDEPFAGEILSRHGDGPEGAQPDGGEQHGSDGSPSPWSYGEQFFEASGFRLSGSRSGAPLAPPLGDLTGFDGGATDLQIGPLNNFLIYADHMVGYRFIPRGLQQTDIQTVWLVHEEAQPGRDYDPDDLTWLWHVTPLDDERIIRHNQQGVNSQFFQPGPLAEMEGSIRGFYESYLTMIAGADWQTGGAASPAKRALQSAALRTARSDRAAHVSPARGPWRRIARGRHPPSSAPDRARDTSS